MYLILRVFTDSREGVENAIGEAVTGIAVLRRPHIVAVAVEHGARTQDGTHIVYFDFLTARACCGKHMHCLPRAGKLLFGNLSREFLGIRADFVAFCVSDDIVCVNRYVVKGLPRFKSL